MLWRIPGFLIIVGCVNSRPSAGGAEASPSVAALILAPISLSESEPLPAAVATQATWQLADRGDPMHLAVLARQIGAAELATRVADGGRSGAIALAAFEHAPDAYPERERLCSLIARLEPPFRERGLRSLSRLLSAGSPQGEDTEPGAPAACRAALQALPSTLADDERDALSLILKAL